MGLIVRSSAIHAAGCYTTTPIAKGTRVVEYTGPLIDKEEADRRYETKPITYLFGIGDGSKVIDGHGIAMFINHSCDANCETEEIDGRVWIIAIRDIAAGEELCYDYCLYDGDDEDAPCNCGAKKCRGSMYSAEELRRRKRRALKRVKEASAKKKKVKPSASKKKQARTASPLKNPPKPAETSGKKRLQRKASPASRQRKSTSAPKGTKKARGK
ncbi:MAG: SET domain-containing protein [Acidobacteriaceae bacterium]